MENWRTYLIIGGVVILILGILMSKKFKGKLSSKGIEVESGNEEKTSTRVKRVKNKSEIKIDSPENRDIDIEDIDGSKITINK